MKIDTDLQGSITKCCCKAVFAVNLYYKVGLSRFTPSGAAVVIDEQCTSNTRAVYEQCTSNLRATYELPTWKYGCLLCASGSSIMCYYNVATSGAQIWTNTIVQMFATTNA